MNNDFSFRIHIVRSPRTTLEIDIQTQEFEDKQNNRIIAFSSLEQNSSIKQSNHLIIKSSGWSSEAEASVAAEKYLNIFRVCFAKLRLGVDYGRNLPKSMFTKYGLAWLTQQTGHERILNDIYGSMVYETNPTPRFVTMQADAVIGKPREQLIRAFDFALQQPIQLSSREQLSIDVFNASFFQKSEDVRFLLLVMAIEALLESEPRSANALGHVEKLIGITEESKELTITEKESLLGSLRWLKNQSINYQGRKIAKDRLGSKLYSGKTPEDFFSYCYHIRSRLVHGDISDPMTKEIRSVVATLEVFVSDLLAGPLRDLF
jgi:hypothetical protein